MSRRRSPSPRHRSVPWEEPDFDPHRDGPPPERPPRHDFREHFREEPYAGGPRRHPSPDRPPFRWPRHPEEESPPHPEERRAPPQWDGGRGAERWRGFRSRFPRFDGRGRSSRSPREQPPHAAPPPRREDRGGSRFREPSPGGRAEEERGRRSTQRPPPPPLHRDRSPPFKRHRADSQEDHHPGFRDQEDFWGHGDSADPPRGEFGGNAREDLPRREAPHHREDVHYREDPRFRDGRRSGHLVMEHGHREPPRWEEFDGEAGPGGPRHQRRSEERFRHGSRERRLQDPHEARRSSPPPPDRFPGRFENRGGPPKYRGRGASRPMRNRYNHNRGARTGPPRTQIRFPQSSQEYEELPEEHGGRYRPLREEHVDPPPGEDSWVEQDRQQDPDPKMSRHKQHGWNRPELDSGGAAAEETLTIKVDMSRPAPLSSTSSYSADRQLSLDLVHVGRQRLDFLPMLEHSGTFRESNMHSGTFAQEIISLVHQVKDQYFRGGGLTLNQRFSAPPNSSCSEDEAQELTLDRRFSSNRGFSLNISSLLDEDDEAPLLSRLPPVQGLSQPVRGPGDLRHDLERRRQEKLEEVKVTIPGRSRAQRPPAAASEHQYSSRMQEERTGPRRGAAPHGPPTRNQGFTNRRPNFHSGSTGSDW